MEANRFLGPTCVLKINVKCCKACPVKLRKKLQKSPGVNSILVDKEKDLVIVSGNIDPTKLVDAIKRIGKKNAEVLFYEKDPSLVPQKLNHLFNKISGTHCEDSDTHVVDDAEDNEENNDIHDKSCEFSNNNTIHKLKRTGRGSHRHDNHHHYNVHGKGSENINIRGRVFANPSAAAATRGYEHVPAGLPPARPPYVYQGYDWYPTMMYSGPPRPPPPPLLPAYHDRYRQINLPPPPGAALIMQPAYTPYYKRRDPPNSNSIFHYFSDDNSEACTII
ncbi:heavy metal-associated isoprenylated plant protein 42-like [Juglans microcarpa x Juglans regia]|uniref:heavy metal-associated isoprenylated plant protein 42-like n=1 Tax=Juglans microcarpa x Juglans regia TaxID=2249226 RepID=UPI001B7E0893|nr:heavy metal-associated isoprenylated plant protein 42-like [Juglans microcarpa x Juglans regia]